MVAAIGKNRELGFNNKLIWHLKDDLQFFKNLTMNKVIVMGYNTFKSLPKLLSGRRHIVLTHKKIGESEVKTFNNIDSLLRYLEYIDDDIFIIGGYSIYKEFIDKVDLMYLTEIDDVYKDADVYFPDFDKSNWIREELGNKIENNIKFKFVLYKRRS